MSNIHTSSKFDRRSNVVKNKMGAKQLALHERALTVSREYKRVEFELIQVLQEIERENAISARDISSIEFAVFSHLRFNLSLCGRDYYEHLVRLLKTIDIAPSEYFGDSHDEVTNLLKDLANILLLLPNLRC